MEKELLKLKPKRFLCPYCGEWHEWNRRTPIEYHDNCNLKAYFVCSNALNENLCKAGSYGIYHDNFYLYWSTRAVCQKAHLEMNEKIPISAIREDPYRPIITFDALFISDNPVGSDECRNCLFVDKCNCAQLGDKGDKRGMIIKLGFEFEQSDYDKYSKAVRERKEREQQELERQYEVEEAQRQELARQSEAKTESKITNQAKEEKTMAEGTKISIKNRLYECSPKENLEIVKQWAEKYKPVLKWAVPVAAIYGAYRILNSDEFDLSVNNIAETCEKRLGFKIEFLENKKALKELMALGGISATAYGAMKAVSTIFNSKDEEEISMEDVENGMEKLDTISQKFAWLQPKTESMLPIALSVIMVYVTLHKPKCVGKFANKVRDLTEDIQVKISTYLDLAKLFIADKLNIDLSDEKEQQKLKICIFLCTLVGISVFLYGKKVLGNEDATEAKAEEGNKSVEAFVEQAKAIIEKIAPTVYTTLITFLVSKKLLLAEETLKAEENTEDTEAPTVEVAESVVAEEQEEAEDDATDEQDVQKTTE